MKVEMQYKIGNRKVTRRMAPRTPKYKRGQQFGEWTLRRFIDSGGNGEVWEVESSDGRAEVLKALHRFSGDAYPRFTREVEIVGGLDPAETRILPILDSYLPDQPSREDPPWYVMPLATGIHEALSEATLTEKVNALREVTETLAGLLLQHGLNHRDVKLANLYLYWGRFVVGDFGLARRPEDPAITGDRPIGPWLHLPSEVFVSDREPDWEKVDVHCLGNTLWQLVSGAPSPPRGPILADGEYSLARRSNEDYVGHLDQLIAGATSESPESRPTLQVFAQQLQHWIEGHEIRDSILREDERMRRNGAGVLRWLVAFVQENPVFDSLKWEVPDPSAQSEIDGLTEGEVGEALEELEDRYLITGHKHEAFGGRVDWTNLYPTLPGLDAVDNVDVLMARAAPLLRELMTRQDGLIIPSESETIEIGSIHITPAEAFFQLKLLQQQGYVSFRDANEARGGSVFLLDVGTTPSGRDWLVSNYTRT